MKLRKHTTRFSPILSLRLKEAAKVKGVPVSTLTRKAVEEYLTPRTVEPTIVYRIGAANWCAIGLLAVVAFIAGVAIR